MNSIEYATLATASRRAAALSIFGAVIVLGSLAYSGYKLRNSEETLAITEKEVKAKAETLEALNKQVEEAKVQLVAVRSQVANIPESSRPKELESSISQLDSTISAASIDARAAVELPNLVEQMNDASKGTRIGAVERLITQYRSEPLAVDLAVSLLEPPKLPTLSASGRINVLVFLRNTDASAWTSSSISRAHTAIDTIRRRSADGSAAIGIQTEEALEMLAVHLSRIES